MGAELRGPETFMRKAIALSRRALEQGCGGPFGAVVVKDGTTVGRGWNRVTTSNDPTAHAEIVAIRDACRRLGQFRLDDCDLYTSCEPCPMCLAAAYWARLRSHFYGNTRKDAARIAFDDALIYRQLALPPGKRRLPMRRLLADEAIQPFREWEQKAEKVPY